MAADVADWTQSVQVTGGSVSITGTATVQITGTPTVQFAAGQSVSISGTPSVTIASGSVTIANAAIGVINATNTKITSARPPQFLGNTYAVAGTVTNTFTLPSDVHALVIALTRGALANVAHLKISYHSGGGLPVIYVPFEIYTMAQVTYAVPILPIGLDNQFNSLTTIDVALTQTGSDVAVGVWALFEGEPEWLTVFPQPQLAPNQTPKHVELTLANDVGQWLIAPVANVQITIFKIDIVYFNPGGANIAWYIGHATALPGPGLTPIIAQILSVGFQVNTYTPIDFRGAQLPRGEGIYAIQELGANQNFGAELIYSLS